MVVARSGVPWRFMLAIWSREIRLSLESGSSDVHGSANVHGSADDRLGIGQLKESTLARSECAMLPRYIRLATFGVHDA